jgi:hypothetical protein
LLVAWTDPLVLPIISLVWAVEPVSLEWQLPPLSEKRRSLISLTAFLPTRQNLDHLAAPSERFKLLVIRVDSRADVRPFDRPSYQPEVDPLITGGAACIRADREAGDLGSIAVKSVEDRSSRIAVVYDDDIKPEDIPPVLLKYPHVRAASSLVAIEGLVRKLKSD